MIVPAAPQVNAIQTEKVRGQAAPLQTGSYRKYGPAEQSAIVLKVGAKKSPAARYRGGFAPKPVQ